MACRNCYKYPFCEKCESPKGICPEFKKKRIEFEKEKENLTIEVQKYKNGFINVNSSNDTRKKETIR